MKDCWSWGTGESELEWWGRGGQTGTPGIAFHYMDVQSSYHQFGPLSEMRL